MIQSNFEIHEFDVTAPYCSAPGNIAGIPVPSFLGDIYENHIGRIAAQYTRELNESERNAFGDTLGSTYAYGGPILLGADELADAKQQTENWARGMWSPEGSEQAALWMSTVPFAGLQNGDYVGFDTSGQIIYLCHDDHSFVLANTFEDFWSVWGRVYFIGPEWWMLEPFAGDSGVLDSSSDNITMFRAAFEATLAVA